MSSGALSASDKEADISASGPSRRSFLASAKKSASPSAQTVLSLLKDASGMIQNAPYVRLIASIMLEILKIKDEVTACRDKWAEVMGDIQGIQKIIGEYAGSETTDMVLSDEIKTHLRDLEKVLEAVTKALARCSGTRKTERIRLALQRHELRSLVDACKEQVRTELAFFNTRVGLANNRLLQSIHSHVSNVVSSQVIRIKYILPAKPQIMHGRDDIIAELVTAILNGPAARIALLGPGGIGKTSIALSVLHHDEIQKSYKDACYFLACDAIDTRDALIISIGQLLGVTANAEQILDESRVLNAVKNLGRAVLCLDNFETPWEAQSSKVEEFLSKLAAIHSVHLMITMRGEQLLLGVSQWKKSLVKPLDLGAALKLFQEISGYNDEHTQALVKAVDFVPLAVNLLAHYTQTSGPEEVWKQWSRDHFKMMSREEAQHNRLASVEYSIELSLKSPRLQKNSECLLVLSILSLLPDGIDDSQKNDIGDVLELENSIIYYLQLLKKCALISDNTEQKKVKLLSPISLYIKKHHPLPKISLLGFANMKVYIDRWITECDAMKNRHVRADCNNLRTILEYYLQNNNEKKNTIEMIIAFVSKCQNAGINEMTLLLQCEKDVQNMDEYTCIKYLYTSAKMSLRFGDITDVENLLSKALTLAIEINNVALQANIHLAMGTYYQRVDRLDEVKYHLKKALQLHQQAQSILGQANDLQNLGELDMRLNDLDQAKHHFEEALQLHQQAQDALGQANDLQVLGELDMRLDDLDQAKHHFEEALQLHQQAQDALGQANDLQNLGELDIRLDNLIMAKQHFEEAQKLHRRACNAGGEAWALKSLQKVQAKLE